MSQVAELRTKNGTAQVALRGVRLSGRVVGMHQHITMEQTYVNLEQQPIEAHYTFPLPADATVCGFEVHTEDRVLVGEVDDIDSNANAYEYAIDRGDAAFLIEEHRPDIFAAWVGNIKPGQAVTIRISYLAPIEVYERMMRIALPTTVSPRYITSSGGRDPLETAVDDQAVNPPHLLHVPYGLSIELDIEPAVAIREIQSPSHAIRVLDAIGNKRGKVVKFATEIEQMDRDVVLSVELEREHSPSGLCCRDEDGHAFAMVQFIPEFDESLTPEPAETVFLIDTSSSMAGSSLRQAIQALVLCLRSLSIGDSFNVIAFNSSYQALSKRPLLYSAKSLRQAIRWVEELSANGGTELHAPLGSVLTPRPVKSSVRQIILLTDGQVSNEEALIHLARRHAEHNRIFTFAIGYGASQHLTGSLAEVTGGVCESIAPGERIDEKVLRTFARLSTPLLSNIQVDWGSDSNPVEQTPGAIRSLFEGDPLTVFARMRHVPEQVRLSCTHGNQKYSWWVDLRETNFNSTLPVLWARHAIRDLELVVVNESISARPRRKRMTNRQRMIDLSCRYQILCQHTSFLAVETRSDDERTDAPPVQRRIPLQLTADWGGFDGVYSLSAEMFSTGMQQRSNVRRRSSSPFDGISYSCIPMDNAIPSETETEPWDHVTKLLALQQAEGDFRFTVDQAFSTAAEFDPDSPFDLIELNSRLQERAEALGLTLSDAIVETLVVLAVLEGFYAEQRPLWKRASQKAEQWLRKVMDPRDRQEISLVEICS